ncbi:MAG: hypothetical protein JWQ09_2979 [Segetibacter sp.]|nr:hypothetical protein [Segetibacter sp.]
MALAKKVKCKTKGIELQYIGRAIKILKPDVLEEIKPLLIRPLPILIHFTLLPALLLRFCELNNVFEKEVVGIWQGKDSKEHKTMFIAVVLKLYNPDLLTGIHVDVMRASLARELSGVLKVDRSWISQQVGDIKTYLAPYRPLKAYEEFRKEAEELARVLEVEFKHQ